MNSTAENQRNAKTGSSSQIFGFRLFLRFPSRVFLIQRLELKHDLETKLEKGAYRALGYSDLGLIGAVGFRLR